VKEEAVPEPPQQPPSRKKSRKPVEQAPATPQPMEVDEDAPPNERHNDAGAQKIALPFSDTPVINRNKEMRKKGGNGGSRRSSLGMRGRRASSLIENGHSAIPHKEVDPSEFYKHIEAESLLEPRRMKQLLTWCGERALCEKPPHGSRGSSAILGGECCLEYIVGRGHAEIYEIARAIQDQLLKDFGTKPEFSDWFGREDVPRPPVVLKPNPKNIEHDAKIAELEASVQR
jgi:kinetochore protein Mis13/DSN1